MVSLGCRRSPASGSLARPIGLLQPSPSLEWAAITLICARPAASERAGQTGQRPRRAGRSKLALRRLKRRRLKLPPAKPATLHWRCLVGPTRADLSAASVFLSPADACWQLARGLIPRSLARCQQLRAPDCRCCCCCRRDQHPAYVMTNQ